MNTLMCYNYQKNNIENFEVTPGTDFIFNPSNNTIIGYTGTNTDITIPLMIGNRTVNTLSDGVTGSSVFGEKITSVDFELNEFGKSNVTVIGDYTFNDCKALTSVTIPGSVTIIGKHAFKDCVALKSINIPASVTELLLREDVNNQNPFHGCISLTSFTVDPENPNYSNDRYYVLFNKNKTELIQFPLGSSNTLYKIPESVTNIKSYAFGAAKFLTTIYIPEGVNILSAGAFMGIGNLNNIIIPKSVTDIGPVCFYSCKKLYNVVFKRKTVPNMIGIGQFDSVGKDYDSTFNLYSYGWTKAQTDNFIINYAKGVTKVHTRDLSCGKIAIPSFMTYIADDEYNGCSYLSSIIIPNSVTTIGNNAFKNCGNLASITIQSGVTSIGSNAFGSCLKLITIRIPDSVIDIGNSAFDNCTSLNNITLSNNITSINDYMFNDCIVLPTVLLPNVTNIGVSAFDGCAMLNNITIPDTVTTIGNSAFAKCSILNRITIPDSVNIIGNSAFSNCGQLSDITFMGSFPDTIGNSAFYNINANAVANYSYWSDIEISKFGTDANRITFNNLNSPNPATPMSTTTTTTTPTTTTTRPTTTTTTPTTTTTTKAPTYELKMGKNIISSKEISIDSATLKNINTNIYSAIKTLIQNVYGSINYTTTQDGSTLYVDVKESFNNMENFAEEIKYVIFRFPSESEANKLLNTDISKYKKVNYVMYILILLILLLIIFFLLNIK
jgi:hypothetical protein